MGGLTVLSHLPWAGYWNRIFQLFGWQVVGRGYWAGGGGGVVCSLPLALGWVLEQDIPELLGQLFCHNPDKHKAAGGWEG